jgi:hypothetical protein
MDCQWNEVYRCDKARAAEVSAAFSMIPIEVQWNCAQAYGWILGVAWDFDDDSLTWS